MLKKTVKYINFNDEEVEETFYFNLTKAELAEMEVMYSEEGFMATVEKIVKEKDNQKIMTLFQDLLRMSYGEKSKDGSKFDKRPELFEAFKQTQAYSDIFMDLLTNEATMVAFVTEVMPRDLQAEVRKELAKQQAK